MIKDNNVSYAKLRSEAPVTRSVLLETKEIRMG